jgi:DNA-binding transcriptional LysR family regulator
VSDINWNAVYGFWLVAEHHSFAAAARDLPRGSVQALHKRVRTLEEQLSFRLLRSRGTKGVELTEAGRRVFELISPVFRDFDRLTAELRGEDSGPLHVAATEFASHNFLPEMLSEFSPLFPNVSIHVHMRVTAEVIALVESGHADFGICSPPAGLTNCVVKVEAPLPSAILVPKRHRFRAGIRSWKDLLEEPLILPERDSLLRTAFDQLMEREKLAGSLRVKAELTAPGLAAQAVRAGLGVALVNVGPRLLGNLQGVFPVDPPPGLPRMRLAVVCQHGRHLPRYMQYFLDTAAHIMNQTPVPSVRLKKE